MSRDLSSRRLHLRGCADCSQVGHNRPMPDAPLKRPGRPSKGASALSAVTCWVPTATHHQLLEAARRAGVNTSTLIRNLLCAHFATKKQP
jgi:hypothetical protein